MSGTAVASRRSRPVVSAQYRARTSAAAAPPWPQGTGRPVAAGAAAPVGRWQGRPVNGLLVRLVALAVPFAASVAAAVLVSRLVARPSGAAALGWWALLSATSTVALLAVDRLARRLLPLAMLLRLSMAFPDRAPSRFSVAFKAGTMRKLRQQLAHAREHGLDDEPARGAERILTLAAALSTHDRGTRHHCERVRAFNDLIAEELRLSQADRDRLRWAALLHDIGKLEVSSKLLRKRGGLGAAEWDEVRRHPAAGARIAAPLAGWLGPWAAAIEQHHEQWGGSGYPKGLAGEQICLGARIVAVADAFEVMTAPRSYKRPVNAQAGREELARFAGTQFDPAVVRAFLNVSIGRLRWTMSPLAWLAHVPFVGAVSGIRRGGGAQVAAMGGVVAGVGAMVLGVLAPPIGASSGKPPSHDAPKTRVDRAVAPRSAPTSYTESEPAVAVSVGEPSSGQVGPGQGDVAGPDGKASVLSPVKGRPRPVGHLRATARRTLGEARRTLDSVDVPGRLPEPAGAVVPPAPDRPRIPSPELPSWPGLPETPIRRR